jgi:sodium/hydrogen antiporter
VNGLWTAPALAEGWHLGDVYTLALVGMGVALLVGAFALTHEHDRAYSASVFYVGLGAVGAVAMSLLGVRPLDPEADHIVVERLTELALIVAVFSAGLTIERRVERHSWVSIATLLLVVMPLTILAVAAFGVWAMGLSFGAALLLGTIVAPTDPVLAGDIGLSEPGGETFGEPRLSLHTEAGFNDGLASPFVVLALFVAQDGGTDWFGEWFVADLLYAAGVGLVVGALAGTAAAALLTRARRRGWLSPRLDGLLGIALALTLYGATEAVGEYGLLAVFAAGFAFRRYEFDHELHAGVYSGTDVAGTTMEFVVLLLLGTMLTLDGLSAPGLSGWLLVPVLLVLIRPLLVLATVGRGNMDRGSRLFLGFFGVRGVAALFYAAVVAQAHVVSPSEQRVIVWTTIICVVGSIVVHGLSADALTRRWLGRG